MTLAEYYLVIQWQLDDRLQFMPHGGEWADWLIETAPSQGFHFTRFRLKPESGASDIRPATHHGHGGSTHQAQV